MAKTKFANTRLDVVPSEGGAVRVTIASNVGQGNDGTSLPCKKAWLISNGTDVRVNIGSAASATVGIPVAWALHDTTTDETFSNYSVLELDIDDVSKLYFYGGTNGKVIDILYRL